MTVQTAPAARSTVRAETAQAATGRSATVRRAASAPKKLWQEHNSNG
jgi:hypothetical protein